MTRRFWAPGRVNLIGDHTDYSGGLVLPAAIDHGLWLEVEPSTAIALESQVEQDAVTVAPDGSRPPTAGWGRYVAAVAAELAALGRPALGLRGRLTGDLPAGAGLSSSAALEVVVATALCAVADFQLAPLELAQAAQRAEQRAVGVPCGVMDQAACLLGRADAAVLLHCGRLEHRLVPLPPELAMVVLDSGVQRRLESSGYATRRAELERGLVALRGRSPVDVTVTELDALVAAAGVDKVAAARLRHVVTENVRVTAAAAALAQDPVDRAALGELFANSHASLRDDYQVTVPETDLLVELCDEAGAVAARMTGAGFGGAVIALVDADRAEPVGAQVAAAYQARQDRWRATVVRCRAADGAGERG
ncbi:MAG: galactokinase [Actinomycetota bacterium]|jgi:galactokinase|nr:galactokinase [Actinomycetota bacterium]